MTYQGGKFRQSKIIAPIVNKCIKENNIKNYYEPFIGGANILNRIECENYYANDIDDELIAFYQYIKDGGEPVDFVTKEEYNSARDNPLEYPKYYLGNIKYMSSFGGKPWGGYAGIDKRTNRTKYEGAVKNFRKQIPKIKQVHYTNKDYSELVFKEKSMIICDPPYKGTTPYRGISFNHEKFYDWFREVSKKNFVILCEYSAPEDFICFKENSVTKTLSANTNVDKVKDCLWYVDGLFKNWYEEEINEIS